MAASNLTISNETRAAVPRALFRSIKTVALGRAYSLSVVVTAPAEMKKLNAIYRGKEKTTDILSFPISKNEGEIYLCPAETRTEAKKFDRTPENFLAFLFIHGCVHLKGYDHGSTMERIEVALRNKFKI